MAWEKDEAGQLILDNGNPVWIDADSNSKVSVDYQATISKIQQLNNEAKGHRLKANDYQQKLNEYETSFADIDPKAARDALDTIQKLDEKKLIDAKQVDIVKSEWAKDVEKQKNEWQTERQQLMQALDAEKKAMSDQMIRHKFTASKQSGFLRNINMTPDVAYLLWKDRFRLEQNQNGGRDVIPYLNPDTPMPSNDPLQSHASFEEAIEKFYNSYEYKEQYAPTNQSGSGSLGGTGPGSGNYIIVSAKAAKDATVYRKAVEKSQKTGMEIKWVD